MPRSLFSCFPRGGSSSSSFDSPASTSAVTSSDTAVVPGESPVMVELFSSQGCATSPEAELLVSRLGRGDFGLDFPVIVLAYHVDYWDYMGWKDPFGSSLWTVRQKTYVESLNLDTMFTPQIVVQGTTQFVANDEEALLSNIMSAPRFRGLALQATFNRPSPDTLQVSLTGALRSKVDSQGANVMVALYENGLVTDCPSGENKGKVLANDFVVRKLEKLCAVKDISAKKAVNGTVNFSLWDSFNSSKCGVAVFVQNSNHHIFGSQNFRMPESIRH